MEYKKSTVEEVIAFVQEFIGVSESYLITPETKMETDLGVTGNDGSELLEAAEQHFRVILCLPKCGDIRGTFNLNENEYLFHSEGLDLLHISTLIRCIRSEPRPVIKDLTVDELHSALLRAKSHLQS